MVKLSAVFCAARLSCLSACCRKVFEPFGGIRSAFTAARDGKPVDSQIEMASSGGLFTSDPDYAPPCVGDIEIVFIAFDILFVDEEVCLCLDQPFYVMDIIRMCATSVDPITPIDMA